jgi:Excreted virulence factor EspC, type VII ESX diderm
MRFDSRVRHNAFARTGVDVGAVHRVADQLRGAAELIDAAVSDHLAGLAFSGATAGRAHTARGDALRARLEQLVAQLSQWSRASVAIAVELRAAAERYADAELYAAARIA